MAHVISIMVNKGGCGKTALTSNTAYELARRGYRVLICDNDSQANSTSLFLKQSAEESVLKTSTGDQFIQQITDMDFSDMDENSELSEKIELFSNYLQQVERDYEISDVLAERVHIRKAVQHTEYANIDILPSSDSLGTTDMALKQNMDDTALRSALEEVYKDYDFILIDNQAFDNALTVNAIESCYKRDDMILVPIKIDFGGLEGWINTCSNVLKRIKKHRLNCKLRFLVTMKNRNKVEDFYTNEILKNIFGKYTFETVIRFQGAPVARASMERKIVLENEKSKVGDDYIQFVEELLNTYDEPMYKENKK